MERRTFLALGLAAPLAFKSGLVSPKWAFSAEDNAIEVSFAADPNAKNLIANGDFSQVNANGTVAGWDTWRLEETGGEFRALDGAAGAFGVTDGEYVDVELCGERKSLFYDVQVRAHKDFRLEMHIDTDDANAAGVGNGFKAKLIKRK